MADSMSWTWQWPCRIAPAVTEKAFDEFHLYDIARPTTLHDHETKQVEFVHAEKMYAPTIYVYDGATNYRFYGAESDQSYGQSDNKKIIVQREFKNAETNQLGIALPPASCASTAAMPTASCSSSARTPLTTRRATRPSA